MNSFDLLKVSNANFGSLNDHTQQIYKRQSSPNNDNEPKLLQLQSQIGHQVKNIFCGHTQQEHALHGKCTKKVKTKWDKFQPYSFHRLSNQQKDRTFLQLYDDYRGTKSKLNQQIHKCTRITTKMHMLQAQISKLKVKDGPVGEKNRLDKQKNQQICSLKQQIRRLHAKIVALTGNKHKFNTRPKTANKMQKEIIPVNENFRAQLQAERKHVRQLLLIIDELKKNKFEVQNLLKTSQANQSQVSRPKNNKSKVMVGGTQSQFHQYVNQLHNWKQKYNDLQLAYNQMSYDKDKKIKQLSSQVITLKQNQRMKERLQRRGPSFDLSENNIQQEKIRQLRLENQKLQKQLRNLVKMPFYQNNQQIVDAQQKIKQLEIKYEKVKDELKKTAEKSTNFFAELQVKSRQNEMLKVENEKTKKQLKQIFEKEHTNKLGTKIDVNYDDYYRKMMHLVKLQGDDPIWKKFQLIAKPQFRLMNQTDIKNLAESLWHSKLELLAHLQKAQIQLKTLKQGMDNRINLYVRDKQSLQQQLKIARARLDEWRCMDNINQRRPYQVFQQAGIKYDDTISVFDADETELRELQSNDNYFDLYLGNINIDEGILMKNPQNKIKNTSHFISFLTIDFYNHETQHSSFAEGVVKRLGNNYSFKVQVNTYFLKYLSKNSISVELWSPQGTATVLLGKGQIYLSQLINKAAQDISTVIRGKCQIYYNEKLLIATVQYRLRMRLPIHAMIQWAQSKNQFKVSDARDPFMIGKRRVLQISIERAQGLPAGIHAFTYFNVQQEDFFTDPERGPNPVWNYKQEIQVNIDQQFADELKQKYFQFTIFDDQKQVNQDVYGIAKASFTPLLELTDSLDLNLDIEDRHGDKKGKLKVKAKWVTF